MYVSAVAFSPYPRKGHIHHHTFWSRWEVRRGVWQWDRLSFRWLGGYVIGVGGNLVRLTVEIRYHPCVSYSSSHVRLTLLNENLRIQQKGKNLRWALTNADQPITLSDASSETNISQHWFLIPESVNPYDYYIKPTSGQASGKYVGIDPDNKSLTISDKPKLVSSLDAKIILFYLTWKSFMLTLFTLCSVECSNSQWSRIPNQTIGIEYRNSKREFSLVSSRTSGNRTTVMATGATGGFGAIFVRHSSIIII